MPDIITISNEFRSAILRRERKAAARLITSYGLIWNRLNKRITDLGAQITEARARGEVVNQFWLLRQERYFALLGQVNKELRDFATFADETITKQQSAAVKAGLSDSFTLM